MLLKEDFKGRPVSGAEGHGSEKASGGGGGGGRKDTVTDVGGLTGLVGQKVFFLDALKRKKGWEGRLEEVFRSRKGGKSKHFSAASKANRPTGQQWSSHPWKGPVTAPLLSFEPSSSSTS